MKIIFKSTTLLIIGVSITLLLLGCSAKGPKFTEVEKIEKNKSLIYVYRPSVYTGSAVTYDVHAKKSDGSDIVIGNLKNGGYLKYKTEPDEIEFWARTEASSSVTIDVQANKMYCIKGEVGPGLFIIGRPHLRIVDNALCMEELKSASSCIDE